MSKGENRGRRGKEVTGIHSRALWAAGRTWAFALSEVAAMAGSEETHRFRLMDQPETSGDGAE